MGCCRKKEVEMFKEVTHNAEQVAKAAAVEILRRQMSGRELIEQLILSTFAHIILISPVLKGRYRAAHMITEVGEPEIPAEQESYGSAEQAMAEGENQLSSIGFRENGGKRIIYIVNPLPYAWSLEAGHSKQAPAGVYSIAAKRAEEGWRMLSAT